MLCYVRADLRRISRRIPRLIVLALLYALLAVALIGLGKEDIRVSTLMIFFEHYVVGFLPLVIGTMETAVILGDDFHAKTMQQAIGMGVSRTNIVLCKLCDVAVLVLADIVIFGAVILGINGVCHLGMDAGVVRELLIALVGAWVKSVAYGSLSMILAFYAQNALFAMLMFIALASGAANKLLGVALGMKAITALHLERFLLTTQINTFFTHALLGYFDLGALIMVLLYVAAGAAAAAYLFKSIELEL